MDENNKCDRKNAVSTTIFICCDVRKNECKRAEFIKQGSLDLVLCTAQKCNKEVKWK